MRNKSTYFPFALLLGGLSFVWMWGGCTKEELDFNKYDCDTCGKLAVTPQFNIPLVSINAKVEDFVNAFSTSDKFKSGVRQGYFERLDTVFSFGSEQVLKQVEVRDTSFSVNLGKGKNDTSTMLFLGVTPKAMTEDVRLKSVTLAKNDTVNVELLLSSTSTDKDTISVTISVFNFAGKSVWDQSPVLSFPAFTPSSSPSWEKDTSLVLRKEVVLALNADTSQPYNRIAVRLDISGKRNGNSSLKAILSYKSASSSPTLTPTPTHDTMSWKAVSGFLGHGDLTLPKYRIEGVTDSSWFEKDKLSLDPLQFEGVYANLKTHNKSIGVPLKIKSRVSIYKKNEATNGGILMQDSSTFFDNTPLSLASPADGAADILSGKKWDSAFSKFPDTLFLDETVTFNEGKYPDVDTAQFLSKSDALHRTTFYQKVPMRLADFGLSYTKTIEGIDHLIDSALFAKADSARLNFRVLNRLPLSLNARLILLDKEENRFDSIDLPPILVADLDAQGKAIHNQQSPVRSISVMLSSEKLRNIAKSKRILLKVGTKKEQNPPSVVFNKDDYVEMGLGIDLYIQYRLRKK